HRRDDGAAVSAAASPRPLRAWVGLDRVEPTVTHLSDSLVFRESTCLSVSYISAWSAGALPAANAGQPGLTDRTATKALAPPRLAGPWIWLQRLDTGYPHSGSSGLMGQPAHRS